MGATIVMTRGDTCHLKFKRVDANGDTILTRAQDLYFTVKRSYSTRTPLIQKTVDEMTFDGSGYYHLTISPADTDGLSFGEYVFDVEVKIDDYVQTICKGVFRVTEEATWKVNEV